MKRFAVSFLTILTLMALLVGCAMQIKTPVKINELRVVMLGIGAKNPTFDESRFPHLTFVYTPGLVSQAKFGGTGKAAVALAGAQEVFKGTPEVLERWWDAEDIRSHALLFDKNGICSWEGYIRQRAIQDIKGNPKDTKLGEMMARLVYKGETTKPDPKKKFRPEKKFFKDFFHPQYDPLLRIKMPEFDVTTLSGETIKISSLIETGRPTLVVFFQITPDADLQEAKESHKGKSGKEFFSAMVRGAAGSKFEELFINMESQLFRYDAREK